MRGASAAILLNCSCLFVGCSEVTEPLVEIEAHKQAFPTILRSQLPNREREELVWPEFRVSNRREFPVSVTLLDQDCSCYSVSCDGKPWKVDDVVELPVAGQVTIRLEVHPSLQTGVQSWTIRTGLRGLTDESSVTRQELELTAGLRILEDLEMEPAVLELTASRSTSAPGTEDSSREAREHLVTVWHTGVERSPDTTVPQPAIQQLPAWMRVTAIHPIGQPTEVEPGFVRQRWQFRLTSQPSLESNLEHRQYRSRVVMAGPASAPSYARNLPIVIRKLDGLMGPGQLALGVSHAGEVVARRLLIRAVDDRPFRIMRVETEERAYAVVRQPEQAAAAPRQSLDLQLSPTRTGRLVDRLRIETDHPDQPVWTVEVNGICQPSES